MGHEFTEVDKERKTTMTMHQKIFALIAFLAAISLVVIVALLPRPAQAQTSTRSAVLPCGDTKELHKVLSEKYGEAPIGIGINTQGEMTTLFVSKKGTYTFVISSTNGQSCVLSGGTDWETSILKPEGHNS
jgi:hypothetical protein